MYVHLKLIFSSFCSTMTLNIYIHLFFTRSFVNDLIKLLVLCLYLYSLEMVTESFSEDASGLFSLKKIAVPFE